MWLFGKKGEEESSKVESRIERLDTALENSFSRVKEDISNMNSWLNYFYSQDAERQETISRIQNQIAHLSSISKTMHEMPDVQSILARLEKIEKNAAHLGASVDAVEPAIHKINSLNAKMNIIEESQKNIFDRLREIAARIERVEQIRPGRASFNLREKILKKVARHSKDYIKNLVLSTINKYEQISALNLREMIVEEQGLCSKSTFYRILEEVEAEDHVNMISKGKEKVYVPKIVHKHMVHK